MAGLLGGGGGGGGADYVQDSAPGGADVGETWVDTSASPPREKVWTGSEWVNHADQSDVANSVAWSDVQNAPSDTQTGQKSGGYFTQTKTNRDIYTYTIDDVCDEITMRTTEGDYSMDYSIRDEGGNTFISGSSDGGDVTETFAAQKVKSVRIDTSGTFDYDTEIEYHLVAVAPHSHDL